MKLLLLFPFTLFIYRFILSFSFLQLCIVFAIFCMSTTQSKHIKTLFLAKISFKKKKGSNCVLEGGKKEKKKAAQRLNKPKTLFMSY